MAKVNFKNLTKLKLALNFIRDKIKRTSSIKRGVEVQMPTSYGKFKLIPFLQIGTKKEHVVLFKGNLTDDSPLLVRMHSSCATGDIFSSMRCDCGEQLHKAMELIEKEGRGLILYLNQEGRGIGLMEKMRAYKLQEEGFDTIEANLKLGDIFSSMRCDCGEQLHKAMELIEKEGRGLILYLNQEGRGIGLMEKMRAYKLQEEGFDTIEANLKLGHNADERDYSIGAEILKQLGVTKIRLLTNNPDKSISLSRCGIIVTDTIPLEIAPNSYDIKYLMTKRDRMGHKLHL